MGFEISECLAIEDSITRIQAAKSGVFDVIGCINDGDQKRFQNENIPICFIMSELAFLLSKTH